MSDSSQPSAECLVVANRAQVEAGEDVDFDAYRFENLRPGL